MRMTSLWITVVCVSLTGWVRADELPQPRQLPKEEKKDEQKEEKNEPGGDKANKDDAKPSREAAGAAVPVELTDPFPPPAPPVMDPRTRGWTQVYQHPGIVVPVHAAAAPVPPLASPAPPPHHGQLQPTAGTGGRTGAAGLSAAALAKKGERVLTLSWNARTGTWEMVEGKAD